MQVSITETAVRIVCSYVSANALPAGSLPLLVASIQEALAKTDLPENTKAEANVVLAPAVAIKKSVSNDYIICLEDGRKFKTLKRHLAKTYGLTPAQYRAKWQLPSDYPMVAPSYRAARAAHAQSIGLGRRGKEVESEVVEALETTSPQAEQLIDVAVSITEAPLDVAAAT